jgi:hypothetical protein
MGALSRRRYQSQQTMTEDEDGSAALACDS